MVPVRLGGQHNTDNRFGIYLSICGGGEGFSSSFGLEPHNLVDRVFVTLLNTGHLYWPTAPTDVPKG